MKTHPDTVALDVAAAVRHLREQGSRSIFTVGFCFGGRHSFNQAAREHGLSGVIGFYGRVTPGNEEDTDAPIDRAKQFECPVLGSFGGTDQMIPAESVEAFGKALDDAGVANDLKVYEGAPHSFFDRAFDQFSDECDDAWRRMLSFIQSNSG
jgi:carboxymethylenebutenolidase